MTLKKTIPIWATRVISLVTQGSQYKRGAPLSTPKVEEHPESTGKGRPSGELAIPECQWQEDGGALETWKGLFT